MSLYSHDGHQILQYSANVKKVMLVVEVTNFPSPGKPAEDAHNAMLNVTIPPSLIYSAFRSKVSLLCCATLVSLYGVIG